MKRRDDVGPTDGLFDVRGIDSERVRKINNQRRRRDKEVGVKSSEKYVECRYIYGRV